MNPKWVVWLWANFGQNLQSEYDTIKGWKLDPKVEEMLDLIWKNISPTLQATLWAFIKQVFDKWGPEAAKAILAAILSSLKAELAV